jgi:hypothetical protein
MAYSAERYGLTTIDSAPVYRLRAEFRAELQALRSEMRVEMRSAIDAALDAQARQARSKALLEKSEREFKRGMFLMMFGNVLWLVWALLLYHTDIFG